MQINSLTEPKTSLPGHKCPNQYETLLVYCSCSYPLVNILFRSCIKAILIVKAILLVLNQSYITVIIFGEIAQRWACLSYSNAPAHLT